MPPLLNKVATRLLVLAVPRLLEPEFPGKGSPPSMTPLGRFSPRRAKPLGRMRGPGKGGAGRRLQRVGAGRGYWGGLVDRQWADSEVQGWKLGMGEEVRMPPLLRVPPPQFQTVSETNAPAGPVVDKVVPPTCVMLVLSEGKSIEPA